MPAPSAGDVHINKPLTNVGIKFKNDSKRFLCRKMFPTVLVEHQSDKYWVWDKADFFRNEAKKVGPTGASPIGQLRLSSDSYSCDVFKFAHLIADQERANQDSQIDLDRTKTEDVTEKLLLAAEVDWINKYFKLGVWTGSTTGTDLVGGADFTVFSNFAASSPVTVIKAQIRKLTRLGLDRMKMKLLMAADVWDTLSEHPKFLERYEQVQASILTEQLMAAVLGIGEVIVGEGVENTAAEGATAVIAPLHVGKMLLTYSPDAPSLQMVSAGMTFVWSGLTGSQNSGIRMKRFRRDLLDSDQIQGESAWDHKVTCPEVGVFFSTVL